MTIFDLIFLAGVLASAITLIAAATAALRGRGARAAKILAGCAACAALYVAISLGVAFARPQRVRATTEPWCFDDWCLQVQKVDSTPKGAKIVYDTSSESTARRGARRNARRARGSTWSMTAIGSTRRIRTPRASRWTPSSRRSSLAARPASSRYRPTFKRSA
jgi:hypothetical protein